MTAARRISPEAYAEQIGVKPSTVRRWCRNGLKDPKERNRRFPNIAAVKIGGDWKIDADATNEAISQRFGTTLEKELTRKSLR